ncbi:hypothetical protein [Pseudodesulfovibrio sp.]
MHPDEPLPSPTVTKALAKAFDLMKYDVGLLADDEAKALSDAGIRPGPVQKSAREEPVALVTTSRGDVVAFLRLPHLRAGQEAPPEDMIARISRTIRAERKHARLVVALSDWGWLAEREYLAQRPDAVPDILLGSGWGSGVDGRFESGKRCLWVRSYDKGRTLSEIRLFDWPDHSGTSGWQSVDAASTTSLPLSDKYVDNPDVSALFQ